MSPRYYIIWIVKISKTVIVTKAVVLPCLVEGESALTNLFYFSLQGINSTGERKKTKHKANKTKPWMRVKYHAIKSKTEQDLVKHS